MGLGSYKVGATVPVSDMEKAKEFYEGKLGLTDGEEQGDGGITYPCGDGSRIHPYPSPDNAGKSGATIAFWEVDDIEGVVDELSSKGVSFEHYDSDPIKTNEKGIAALPDGLKVAWCRDQDGNILGAER